jgi:hypothetical protein
MKAHLPSLLSTDSNHVYEGVSGLDSWTVDHTLWAIHPAPDDETWTSEHDITVNSLLSKTAWRGALGSLDDFSTDDLVPADEARGHGAPLGTGLENGIDSTRTHFNTSDTVIDAIVVHTLDANDFQWDMGPFVL